MENKTATTDQHIDSGEVRDVEELLKFLHERGDVKSDRMKQYEALVVTTWSPKSWWELPMFSKYRDISKKESFAIYKGDHALIQDYHKLQVGLDASGALILQNTQGPYPHFLRITPVELRRHDHVVFWAVMQLLKNAKNLN